MDQKELARLELTQDINSIINELRGDGVYDTLQICLALNERLGIKLSVTDAAMKIRDYKETLVHNMLDNYKDNVIFAMEKYVNLYQKAMADNNLKVAMAALDSIVKLQQLDKRDIYDEFGIQAGTEDISQGEQIREEQAKKLMNTPVCLFPTK